MRVIVFGGTGWVGHHIALTFHEAGHDVTIFSRGTKSQYLAEIPDGISRRSGDKNVEDDVAAVFEESFDVVIDSVPTETSIDNIAQHCGGIERYIHCSSTGGYAPLAAVPGDETMPYDHFLGGWRAKAIVDEKVMALHREAGLPATVIRPSYITGPGLLPLDNLGGRRENFIQDILDGVTLDLPNDGQALLHPVHVKDLAKSFLLAAQRQVSLGQIYNICLPKAVPLNVYLELNASALDREVSINHMPVEEMLEKYGDAIEERGLRFLATHMCFDISKAKEHLGYKPSYTTEGAVQENARWASPS